MKLLCKVCQTNSTNNNFGVCNMCVDNKIMDKLWTIKNYKIKAKEYSKNIKYLKKFDC
jgi:hypothetical protein